MLARLKSLFNLPSSSKHPVLGYIKQHFGYYPSNAELYIKAVRHKSAYENVDENNERLEFLGDAILDSIASHYLYTKFPDEFEGFLTQKRSAIVSRRTLNKVAIQTGLHNLVEAKLEQEAKETSIGGNAFEALIGAIYLDKGYAFVQNVFIEQMLDKHIQVSKAEEVPFDPKSRLIEMGQKNKWSIQFSTLEHDSTDSFKRFRSVVVINNEERGAGIGTSKKKAEQQAALDALTQLGNV